MDIFKVYLPLSPHDCRIISGNKIAKKQKWQEVIFTYTQRVTGDPHVLLQHRSNNQHPLC